MFSSWRNKESENSVALSNSSVSSVHLAPFDPLPRVVVTDTKVKIWHIANKWVHHTSQSPWHYLASESQPRDLWIKKYWSINNINLRKINSLRNIYHAICKWLIKSTNFFLLLKRMCNCSATKTPQAIIIPTPRIISGISSWPKDNGLNGSSSRSDCFSLNRAAAKTYLNATLWPRTIDWICQMRIKLESKLTHFSRYLHCKLREGRSLFRPLFSVSNFDWWGSCMNLPLEYSEWAKELQLIDREEEISCPHISFQILSIILH